MTTNNLTPVAVQYKHEAVDAMTVDWYIGKRCNFCCSYCADFLHDNYSKHLTFAQMVTFVDQITNQYGNNITWSITGGEPTLNPDLLNLLEYLKDKSREISICTNGSRSLGYLKQLFKLTGTVVVSFHFEHVSSSIDDYLDRVIDLEKWRIEFNKNIDPLKFGWGLGKISPRKLIARIMARPGYEKEIEYATARLKSANIENLEHRVIRPQAETVVTRLKEKTDKGNFKFKEKPKAKEMSSDTKVYSPDSNSLEIKNSVIKRESNWYNSNEKNTLEKEYNQVNKNRKWLLLYSKTENGDIVKTQEHYNQLNFQGRTNFHGWTCQAGVTLIRVAPNGDIFKANCGQGGPIGNVYAGSFIPPTEPVICQKFRCVDPIDLRQRKYINDNYKHVFNLNLPIENDK
jgi:MoaA/NifB/PqqE/SkfB family radical SAM enzyme